MFLSDVDIHAEVKKGNITLDPFDPKRLQPATYDIRLGNTFIVNDAHSTKAIDPAKGVYPQTQTIEVKDGEEFVLHPGVSILGYSKEEKKEFLHLCVKNRETDEIWWLRYLDEEKDRMIQ